MRETESGETHVGDATRRGKGTVESEEDEEEEEVTLLLNLCRFCHISDPDPGRLKWKCL